MLSVALLFGRIFVKYLEVNVVKGGVGAGDLNTAVYVTKLNFRSVSLIVNCVNLRDELFNVGILNGNGGNVGADYINAGNGIVVKKKVGLGINIAVFVYINYL